MMDHRFLNGSQVGYVTLSKCFGCRVLSLKLGTDEGLKSACSVFVLGELGVTLTVTPPEFIVAVGKRNIFCTSWFHWALVNTNGSFYLKCLL